MKRTHLRFPFALSALMLSITATLAQTPSPIPNGRSPLRPQTEAAISADEKPVSGNVSHWLQNPNGEVEGLLLDNRTEVAFPPAWSARVLTAVKLKDHVQIIGRHGEIPNLIHAARIQNLSTKVSIETDDKAPDEAPRVPSELIALSPMQANGRITFLLHTARGEVNGVLLENGISVRFPPHIGTGSGDWIKKGATIYARGYGTRNALGSVFEATAIGSTVKSAREVFVPPAPPVPPDSDMSPLPVITPASGS